MNLPLPPLYEDPHDDTGPTWKTQNHSLEVLNLTTPAKTLFLISSMFKFPGLGRAHVGGAALFNIPPGAWCNDLHEHRSPSKLEQSADGAMFPPSLGAPGAGSQLCLLGEPASDSLILQAHLCGGWVYLRLLNGIPWVRVGCHP